MARSRSSRMRSLRQMQGYVQEGEEVTVDIVYYSRFAKQWLVEKIKMNSSSIESVGYARLTGSIAWRSIYGFDTIPLVRAMLKAGHGYKTSLSEATIRRVRGEPIFKSSLAEGICVSCDVMTMKHDPLQVGTGASALSDALSRGMAA